jgi:hypothetical protein
MIFYSFAIIDVCSKRTPFLFTKLSLYVNPLVYIYCCTRLGMWVGTMWTTTVLTVFEKIKITDPWIDAKLNSMTHKKKFFNILSFFDRVWLISLQKLIIWPQLIFPKYFQYGYKKMQNLMPISNHWKRIKNVYTKKVRVLRTYVLSTKRWKST